MLFSRLIKIFPSPPGQVPGLDYYPGGRVTYRRYLYTLLATIRLAHERRNSQARRWSPARINCCQSLRKPLFIVGSPRSGTTFLGTAIAALPEYAYHLEPYGSLVAYPYVVTASWSFEQACRYYRRLYHILLLAAGACDLCYAEKNANNSYICDFLSRCFPDSRFIHIIRDGRDVSASICQRLNGRVAFTPSWASALGHDDFDKMPVLERSMLAWSSAVSAVRKVSLELPADRYLELRYEDVIQTPRLEAGRITGFLGIDEPGSVHSIEQALMKVKGESVGRWRHDFGATEAKALNRKLGPLLAELGYPE